MSNPIRILQIFTILNRGGAETNVMNYYRKLDKTKFQFDFAVHRADEGAYEEEVVSLGASIFRFPALSWNNLKEYQELIKMFFDENKYLVIHGQCSELGYFFYKEASRRGVPVIIAHGHNSNPTWDLKSPMRWLLKKKMMQYVNTYFTCGDEASVWLFGKKNAHKAFTMTNAIDSSMFAYDTEDSKLVRKQLDAEQSLNIIHVGRFNEQKNHDFLIEVFNELLKTEANYKLFLVGEGELKPIIEAKVKQLGIEAKVIFLGIRSDVNQILQGMDVFLFPSFFEGLPVALVEAQAAGLQCYISDGIPKESIIVSENIKVLSLDDDKTKWAATIYKDRELIKKNVASQIINKGYDINTNIKLLEQKYEALIQGKL